MLQITITAEQVRLIRDWLVPTISPFILWLGRNALKKLKTSLNEITTDNANRIRAELSDHIDGKFHEHEQSAFGRIASLERSVAELSGLILKYQSELRQDRRDRSGRSESLDVEGNDL